MYKHKPRLGAVPPDLIMDFNKILNKPYFIFNATWATTAVVAQRVALLKVPLDIFNNALATIPFRASTLYRCKLRLIMQVAGTPMHQGTLLAAALPAGYFSNYITNPLTINTLMSAPHVFMSANEATPVSLEVPFYVNSKLAKTDLDGTTFNPNFTGTDYAEVGVVVLNPLAAPTSGSTSLTISFHAEFLDLEFYAPHTDVTYSTLPTLEAQGSIWDYAKPQRDYTYFKLEAQGGDISSEKEHQDLIMRNRWDFCAQGFVEGVKNIATKAIDGVFSTARSSVNDFLDIARAEVRNTTGLHAPNSPFITNKQHVVARQMANIVDKPCQFEKLDTYAGFDRICKDYIFDTDRDEMNMREILSKPQYLGTFTVKSTDATGALCWSRPITPFQQSIDASYVDAVGSTIQTTTFANNLQNFYYLSRFWRGGLKIHIQACMTNFHYCKLLVAKDYSVRLGALTGYPSFTSVPNLLTDTMEFSAGGQVHTISLPFISPLEQLPCSNNWQNIVTQHGMYYIYINQPLVTNGSVPLNVQFNVYISADDDFEYYGYATDPVRINYPFILTEPPTGDDPTEDVPMLEAQGSEDNSEDAKVIVDVNKQEALTFTDSIPNTDHFTTDLRPITHVRDYLRKMYKVSRYKLTNPELSATKGLFRLDVSELLGIRTNQELVGGTNLTAPCSTLRMVQNMFLGYAGGARIKIVVQGSSGISAWFVPPAYGATTITGSVFSDNVWVGAAPYPNNAAGTAPTIAADAMYSNLKYAANPFDKEFSCQSVIQERPNYIVSSVAALIDPNNPGLVAESSSMLEFEIPNLSPFRFVGDISAKSVSGNNFVRESPTTDLGHIMVFIPQQVALAGSVETGGIYLTVYAGADDTARCGYQVFTPITIIPATASTTPNGFQFITTQNPGNGFTNQSSRNPYVTTNYTKTT